MTNKTLPEGGNTTSITNVFTQISTTGKMVKTNECMPIGKYPVVDQGINFITGYHNDESKVIKNPGKEIVFGDHTRSFKLVDFDFSRG